MWEVVFASGIGVLLAILVVSVINDKLLYTFAQRINLSDKHGEDDVFEFFLGQDHIQWITVRDTETNLIYQGIITSFSQKDDKRELILSSVEAFRDVNGQITEAGEYAYMYFNFDVNSKIILEVNNQ